MTDKKLIEKYDEVYAAGEENFWTYLPMAERQSVIGSLPSWVGFDVLEIGCGTGDFAAQVAAAGVKQIFALDESKEAIDQAKAKYSLDNLEFKNMDYRQYRHTFPGDYDIIIMIGVLEHFEDPFKELLFIMQHMLRIGGIALVTCPNFINPRGYIWMALQTLFDAEMSLTDKHQITPGQMQKFCQDSNFGLSITSLDIDWAMGPRLINDFTHRLPLALPNVDSSKIEKFLNWLNDNLRFDTPGEYNGANLLYQIGRPPANGSVN